MRRIATTTNTAFKVALVPTLVCVALLLALAVKVSADAARFGSSSASFARPIALTFVPLTLATAGLLTWMQHGLYKNNRDALFIATVVVGVEFYATAFFVVEIISPWSVVPVGEFPFLASVALSIWIYLPRAWRA